MSLDNTIIRSSLSSMLQASISNSNHHSDTDDTIDRHSDNIIDQNAIDMQGYNDDGKVDNKDYFLSHGQNDTLDNPHGELYLPQDQTKDKIPSTVGYFDDQSIIIKSQCPCHCNQPTSNSEKPDYPIDNDNIRFPLRKSKSKSILKSSSSYHGNSIPDMKRITSFSYLEIYEYDDISLDNSSEGSQGEPIVFDCDYNHQHSRNVQMIQLSKYEENRMPRRNRTELYMDNRFQTWRKQRSSCSKIEKTAKVERIRHPKNIIKRLLRWKKSSKINE